MKYLRPNGYPFFFAALILSFFACGDGQTPAGNSNGGGSTSDLTCNLPAGQSMEFPTTKLFFEHNGTDLDTGVHGGFDTSSFAELCVYDPNGNQILAVKPLGSLKKLTMGGIFFESREPLNADVSIESLFADFPEGEYKVIGVDLEGTGLTGAATLRHNIPNPPDITFPAEDAVVPTTDLVVTWNAVTKTIFGGAVTITGYEVIITKDVEDDPHGFSRPTFDVHIPPSVTSLTVSDEFLEAGTSYELEVLALAEFGNQTLSSLFFETE